MCIVDIESTNRSKFGKADRKEKNRIARRKKTYYFYINQLKVLIQVILFYENSAIEKSYRHMSDSQMKETMKIDDA